MSKRGWVGVGLFVVALVTFSVFGAAPASATDVVWKTKQIPWAFKVPASLFTGAAKDTMFLQTEDDTTRTDIVSTADWAWDAVGGIGVAAGPVNIATVTIVARTNNGAADSLYYTIEKSVGGQVIRNRTLSAAVGAHANLHGDARADKAIYRGVLQWDNDGVELLNQLSPGDNFRLVVQGDQGGTTPKLSQCRVYVTYPQRAASR